MAWEAGYSFFKKFNWFVSHEYYIIKKRKNPLF